MPYMGKSVDNKSSEIRRFDVTSSTSATHTLSWTAPSEQSLIVTINGVKQHEDAYSVSGTTLTLTSALVATDKLEVIGINDIGSTITPGPGSVNESQLGSDSVSTIKLQDNAITTAKIADDQVTTAKIADDQVTSAKLANTLNIPSGNSLTIDSGATITNNGTATGFGVAGTNAFAARITSELTITSNVDTKLTFDTEDFDSEGVFASNTFTAPVAGKYFISADMYCNANTTNAVRHAQLFIKKNGSDFHRLNWASGSYATDQHITTAILMDLALNDTVDVYVNVNRGGGSSYIDRGFFGGFRIQ